MDLPPLVRCRVAVKVTASALQEYEDTIQNYRERRATLQRQGRTDSTALEMMSALRQLTSSAKVADNLLSVHDSRDSMSYVQVGPTVCVIQELLAAEPGSPVVVFVWFRQTLRELVEALCATSAPTGDSDHETATKRFLRCGAIAGDMVKQSVITLKQVSVCLLGTHFV